MRAIIIRWFTIASLVLVLASCDDGGDSSGPPADPHEDNDTRLTATDFTLGARKWLSDHLTWAGVQSDDDWYRISVAAGAPLVCVDCSFINADGDIDVALVDTSDASLVAQTNNTDGHSFTYEVSAAGEYWIHVSGADAGNTYDLRWQAVDTDATYDALTESEPGVTYEWLDISSGTVLSLSDDQTSTSISLGFIFSFYGTDYASAYVNANGFLAFESLTDAGSSPRLLPDSSFDVALVAAFWRDLAPHVGGTIYYDTLGSAPNQLFVVSFVDVPLADSFETVTTQIVLYEGSNEIQINAQNHPPSAVTFTQGIQNGAGTSASFVAGRNQFSFVPADNASVKF